MRNILLAPALLLLLANAEPAPIPAPLKAMLDAAIASGSDNDVNTIVKYARAAAPDSADEIGRIADQWRKDRKAKADAKLAQADFFSLIKGRVELSGYINDGNSSGKGFSASVDVTREGLRWRHKVHLQTDYQESFGVTSREHYLAAYEPNYKFSDRGYIYGAAQYESDRFLGFYDRVSLSTGAGYSALKSPDLKLDLELGPAYRNTAFTDGTVERNFAARGSMDLNWKLTHAVSFHQNASAYLQDSNSTVTSKSAIQARLLGPLSAQLSYSLQYESMPPAGRETTDTTSRAGLVLDF